MPTKGPVQNADMPWAFFISPIYDYAQHSLRAVMPENQTWVMTVSNVRHYSQRNLAIVYSIVFTKKEMLPDLFLYIFDNKTF